MLLNQLHMHIADGAECVTDVRRCEVAAIGVAAYVMLADIERTGAGHLRPLRAASVDVIDHIGPLHDGVAKWAHGWCRHDADLQ